MEEAFPDELVVIGIHSAKYPNERVDEHLRQAVLRHDIHHPVINDKDMLVWRLYGVRAWPTLVLIDPLGRIIGVHEGEIRAEQLLPLLRRLIAEAERQGLLDRTPLPFRRRDHSSSFLRFPEKVLADEEKGRLFIADTGHHRIVVATMSGKVLFTIGSGKPGLKDGDFQTAQFREPRGMALSGDFLFVADTGNHCIRGVDLRRKKVTTIAGTGKLGRFLSEGGKARRVALRSPWDLTFHDGKLYIAMAGSHQIWVLDLATETLVPFAGNGYEGLRDGERKGAWLAQPSGITVGDGRLYFVDSETSSVRYVDLQRGQVVTLVGAGLFEFGDRDGRGPLVRLQHPLGICVHQGVVYIADTYNHKIKVLFPETRRCLRFAGTGGSGYQDGSSERAKFFEPSGLSVGAGKLFIADTNNHAIRVIDLRTRMVTTLPLK